MSQLAFVGADLITTVKDFFHEVGKELAELWFWPAIFIGFMIVAIIAMFFLVRFSYENRILKSVNRLNKYFLAKPYINEENLVEFNLKMKKVPEVLRSNWQVYMLNREDSPTTYINVNTCIDKPLRTSSIEKNMGNFTIFSVLLGLLSFAIGLVYATHVAGTNILGDVMFLALLVPLAISILYTVFFLVIKASKNDIYSCLYENFPLYERNLTKAVETLPAYVDYEILFTKKEIKDGIPILQQYLEKRAKVEEEELERARENSIVNEEYDFGELGVDGSLVLERAMKECETFIKVRRRMQEESSSIETEKENYKKTFEQTLKDMQRKLQASRENLESLKTEQEASTNRIESNYIRKQQADEIKKQEQLEKDIEQASAKFHEEQETLKNEIEKRDKEIGEKKVFVEQAMMLEFKHYANTLYEVLTEKAKEVGNQKLVSLAQENADLKALLTDIHGVGVENSELNPEENLIKPDEITSENLYEMSGSDESSLEQARKTSKKMEEDENRKIKEKKKEVKNAPVGNPSAEQPLTEPIMKNEENSANTEQAEQPQTSLQAEQTLETTDETQESEEKAKVNEKDVKQENLTEGEVDSNDDYNKIQKQIDEESDKLQKEKVEFENDLNKTISKMSYEKEPEEEPEEEAPRQKPVKKQVEEEPEEEIEEETPRQRPSKRAVEREKEEEFEEEPEEETPRQKPLKRRVEREENFDDEPEEKAQEERPLRRPVTRSHVEREPEQKPRAKSRRNVGRVSRKSSSDEEESSSGLDSLNAEMQKLLKNSKRR